MSYKGRRNWSLTGVQQDSLCVLGNLQGYLLVTSQWSNRTKRSPTGIIQDS